MFARIRIDRTAKIIRANFGAVAVNGNARLKGFPFSRLQLIGRFAGFIKRGVNVRIRFNGANDSKMFGAEFPHDGLARVTHGQFLIALRTIARVRLQIASD